MNTKHNNIKQNIIKKAAIILLCMLALKTATAQIGVNIDTPDSSAVLHIDAPDRGLLIPRHNEEGLVQKPADGLLYYNKQNGLFHYYDQQAAEWKVLVPATVTTNGKVVMNITPEGVGVDTIASANKQLMVKGSAGITNELTASKIESSGEVVAKNYSSDPNQGGNGPIPVNGIIMWSGYIDSIPNGWALCDGTVINGFTTPNLSGRFIAGYNAADADYNGLGKTGGEKRHTLSTAEMPLHNHNVSASDRGHDHDVRWASEHASGSNGDGLTDPMGAEGFKTNDRVDVQTGYASILVTQHNRGSNHAHENRPPYYVLAFIIKLPKYAVQ
jgi:microcystin-dependent protein